MGHFCHSGPHLELLRGISFNPTEPCDAAVAAEEQGGDAGGSRGLAMHPEPWAVRQAGRAEPSD